MGDNRSNVCLGLNGVAKFAFVSLLLSSVCFPHQVLAYIYDGTVLRTALLNGTSTIELIASEENPQSFSVPNPGQEFNFKVRPFYIENEFVDSGVTKSWLKLKNYNVNFMGEVAFQQAYYKQDGFYLDVSEYEGEARLADPMKGFIRREGGETDKLVSEFFGAAVYNDGELSFTGKSIAFEANMIDASSLLSKNTIRDVKGKGAGLYNEKSVVVATDTAALFKDNIIVTGSYTGGAVGDSENWRASLSQGAGLYNAGTAVFGGETVFDGNYVGQMWLDNRAYEYGAAFSEGAGLYNEKEITFGNKVTFKNNEAHDGTATRGGGAFNGYTYYNGSEVPDFSEGYPKMHFKGETTFVGNMVESSESIAHGGGLFNTSGTVIFDSKTVFLNNHAFLEGLYGEVAAGAGIYSLSGNSSVTFNGETNFIGNTILSEGYQSSGNGAGAYVSDGEMIFNGVTNFTGNIITATNGFSYGEGGSIQVLGRDAGATFNNDVTFSGNKITAATYAVGGAIANYSTMNFNKGTIKFLYNQVENTVAEDTYTDEELLQNNVHFIQSRGGALYNAEGNTTFGAGTTVTFEGNQALSKEATAFGGAIYNEVFANDTGRVNFFGTTTFKYNHADTGGGAIFNKGIMTLGGETHFVGNDAKLGGAIYNDTGAQLTILGSNVTFKNNTADLGSNIYNLGTVTIQGVKDTMSYMYEPYTDVPYPEGGHTLLDQSGDIYNAGMLNIIKSEIQLSGINTKQTTNKTIGTISISDSTVDLGLNTIYTDVFDINAGSKIITHVGGNKNGSVVAGSNIDISNAGTTLQVVVGVDELKKGEAKEYQVFKVEGSSSGVNGQFDRIAENYLYTITEKEGEKGIYIVERNDSSATKPNQGGSASTPVVKPIDPNCPSGDCDNYNKYAADAWIDGGSVEENEEAKYVRDALHTLVQNQNYNSQEVQDAVNAITPDTSSLITAHANEVTRQISNAISKRFYSSVERSHYVYNGKIHYKAPRQTSNVWVEGIYGQSEYSGKNKWDMDTMGVAAGIEAKLTKTLKVGAMVAYTNSDGGPSSRDTEIETTAGALYAEYSPSRFYANAFALYGSSKVKEERSVFSRKVESEFDVNIVAAQAIAGYKLGPVVFGNWVSGVISPEAGFRYVYAKQKEYTDSLGQTVEGTDSHTLTGILGAKYTVGYRLSPSMWMYPELRAALTYDFITPTMDSTVVLLNGASYTYETEEMDRFGIEIGVKMGLEIDKRTEIGLEYEGLFKGDYTNHTGVANVKYHF